VLNFQSQDQNNGSGLWRKTLEKVFTIKAICIPNLKDLALGPKGHAMKQSTLKSLAIFMEVVLI